jgi:hypothetical protein
LTRCATSDMRLVKPIYAIPLDCIYKKLAAASF